MHSSFCHECLLLLSNYTMCGPIITHRSRKQRQRTSNTHHDSSTTNCHHLFPLCSTIVTTVERCLSKSSTIFWINRRGKSLAHRWLLSRSFLHLAASSSPLEHSVVVILDELNDTLPYIEYWCRQEWHHIEAQHADVIDLLSIGLEISGIRVMVMSCTCKWNRRERSYVYLWRLHQWRWSCHRQYTRGCASKGACCDSPEIYFMLSHDLRISGYCPLCRERPISLRRYSNEVSSCSIHGKNRRWGYCNYWRSNSKSVIEWMESRLVHATSGQRLI